MNKSENILVSVICNTYNHEPYIRQCLEGFIMQKTTFAFEVLIHDDASTDKTADVIREYEAKYPDLIKPIYQIENQYSKKTGIMKTFQYPRVKGKYIALCEGDDYWIDPFKLQKQVDFLEANPKYVLSHTGFEYLDDGVSYSVNGKDRTKQNITILDSKEDLRCAIIDYNRYVIQTMTVLIRTTAYKKAYSDIEDCSHLFLMGDTPLWLALLSYGAFHFYPEVTSYYRLHKGSACHSVDKKKQLRFSLSCAEMRVFFGERYELPSDFMTRFQREYQRILLKYMLLDSNYKPFVKCKFNNFIDKYLYYIITSNFFLSMLRPIMRIYLKK